MSKYPNLPDATLIINPWESDCNNCGWGANPDATTHNKLLPGYSTNAPTEGCGIEWTHVTSDYVGSIGDAAGKYRPDLIFIDQAETFQDNISEQKTEVLDVNP